jgi:hypothetical protein
MRRVTRQFRPLVLFAGVLTLVSGQSNSVDKQAAAILEAKCLVCHGAT